MDEPHPKGPNGTFKNGQRVPWSGIYIDQHGVTSHHKAGKTFPPCVGQRGGPAYRKLVKATVTA